MTDRDQLQMGGSPKISLVCCAGVENSAIIPHFIRYYRSLGVDEFLVILHSSDIANPKRRIAMDLLTSVGIEPKEHWIGTFLGLEKRDRLNRLAMGHIGPNDWRVNADTDEFVECDFFSQYPEAFKSLIHGGDEKGYTVMPGWLVDMITPDGSLPPIGPVRPLWDQFPVAVSLTGKILRGNCHKVVACKGHHAVNRGAHSVSGLPKRRHPNLLRINHFKWDASVIDRLEERERNYKTAGYRHATESMRFLSHVRERGQIDLGTLDVKGRCSRLGGWSIEGELLKFMLLHVPIGALVLELGSGSGTEELSRFYNMHSIEHDQKWVGLYHSQYISAPVRNGWYDLRIVGPAVSGLKPAAILVDGPPARFGRSGFVRNIDLFDTSGWIIFDDVERIADRTHFEAACAYLAGRENIIVTGERKQFGVILPSRDHPLRAAQSMLPRCRR